MMCRGKEEGEISRGEETRETEGGMRIVKWAGGEGLCEETGRGVGLASGVSL